MSNKKYWQSFGDFNHSESFSESAKHEFNEDLLPIEELQKESLLESKTPRRDFLKYLGFSTAAAAIASCKTPVRHTVPFLNRPETIIPGIANYYASTFVNSGTAISVVVKQREGRPIKIEGNELSPITNGGTSAQVQASVLDLYDPTRLRHPLQKSNNEYKEVTSFDAMDKLIAGNIAALGESIKWLVFFKKNEALLRMFKKLQHKWKVNGWRLILILLGFTIGGSLCGWLGRKILLLTGMEKGVWWVIAYIILVTLLWPPCVLLVSVFLGQFSFFKKYISKIFNRIGGRKEKNG